jgi:predicted dehydrogenase
MKNKIYRIGLLGLDTPHASIFAGILNDPYNPQFIPGAEVVAAYPGGSADMPISANRVAGFTDELRKLQVEIIDDPMEVARRSDLLFITAADGRVHLDFLERTAKMGRPTFIDKPFATSIAQAEKILACADTHKVRLFASSAFRYADPLVDFIVSAQALGERILECEMHCWLPIEETQGRYFWYGIHAVEMSQALFGDGAVSVSAAGKGDRDDLVIEYGDNRKTTIQGSRTDHAFWIQVRTDTRIVKIDLGPAMQSLNARLLWAVLDVLSENRFPPLWRSTDRGSVSGPRPSRCIDPSSQATLEVIRILEASGNSQAQGKPVAVGEPRLEAKYVYS